MREEIKQDNSKFFNKKVAIIGTGYVGASIAYALMIKDVAREIVLIDVNTETANAEILDIRHGIPHMGSAKIYCGEYSDIKDCDLIIITAGLNRKPNESRLDLANNNVKIAHSIVDEIKKYYNQGVILVVSNPVDIITYCVSQAMDLPKGRVLGTGCVLDSSRLVNVISDYIGLEPQFISATVVGEHGASQVVLWDEVKVANVSLEAFCRNVNLEFNDEIKNCIEQKVLNMGTEIIRGKGKTHYGIATCVCHIADAILNKRIIAASVTSVLSGECGFKKVAMSLPSLIDYNGVKQVLESDFSELEMKKLQNSANILSEYIKKLDTISVCLR